MPTQPVPQKGSFPSVTIILTWLGSPPKFEARLEQQNDILRAQVITTTFPVYLAPRLICRAINNSEITAWLGSPKAVDVEEGPRKVCEPQAWG